MDAPAQNTSNQADDSRLNIKYQPRPGLKTTIATGAMSSVTPDMLINLALFTERRTFPTDTSVTFTEEEAVEGDDEYAKGDFIVREINYSVLLTEDAAQYIINTLEHTIKLLKDRPSKN